jgi:hypothetical protein
MVSAAMATACGDPCGAVPGADFADLPKPPQIYHECKRHSFVIYIHRANFLLQGFNSYRSELEMLTRLCSEHTVKQKG